MELSKTLAEQKILRAQLQDIQDTLANRSSATESGERDMALLQAQAREAEMETKISSLRDEYDSVETMLRMKINEAEERESRLSDELQALHSAHAFSVDNVRALQSTIEILESQLQESIAASQTHASARDRLIEVEAKLAMSSETEERQSVKMEYHAAVIRELQGEITDVNRMLEFAEIEYEVLLEASQNDQRTYVATVTELQERMLRTAAEAEQHLETVKIHNDNIKDSLEKEISTLRDNLSAIELSLQESTDSTKVSEDRVGKLRVLLQEREKEVSLLRTSITEIGQPVDGTALQLREAIAQLEARIERRNRQIAVEQEKARKLAMNLQLAQETLEEQDSAIQNVKGELAGCEEKKLVCEDQIDLLNHQNAELVDKIQQITEDAVRQRENFNLIVVQQQDELVRSDITQHHLILQLLIHRSKAAQASFASDAAAKKVDRLVFDVSAAQVRVQQVTALLRKTVERHEQERRESEAALETLQYHKRSLATEFDDLRADLVLAIEEKTQNIAELTNTVDAQRKEVVSAQTDITNILNEVATLKGLLKAAEKDKTTLSQTIDGTQERILEMERLLADANNRLSEQRALESDVVRLDQENKLRKEIDGVQAECATLQQTIQRLQQELADSKQLYDVGTKASQETEAVLNLAKEAAEEEMMRRALERDDLRAEREALSRQIAELQQELEQQQEARKNSEEQLQEATNDIRQKYRVTADLLAASIAQASQLEASLAVAESRCLQLSSEVARTAEELKAAQNDVEINQRRLEEVEQKRSELAAHVSSLEDTVAALQENETRLISENEAAQSDMAANSSSLAELQDTLRARELDIVSLHKSHAEGVQELQAALEIAKREAAVAQEDARTQ